VDDAVDPVRAEDLVEQRGVADVPSDDDCLIDRSRVRWKAPVEDDDAIPALEEGTGDVDADVSGSTGDEDAHTASRLQPAFDIVSRFVASAREARPATLDATVTMPRRVLLIGDDSFHIRTMLSTARAFEAAGWVVGIGSPEAGLAAASRSVAAHHVVPGPSDGLDRFEAAVRRAIERGRYALVLPGGDAELFALTAVADRLPARLPYPPHAVVREAMDKLTLVERAASVGIDVPATRIADGAALDGVAGPVVVKARHHWSVGRPGVPARLETIVAADRAAAREAAERIRAAGGAPLLQDVVAGDLMAHIVLVAPDGRIVARLQQVADRTWPPGAGVSTRARTTPIDPVLAERIDALVAALGWWGLAQFQFVTAPGGQPRLIDLNGRPYGSIALAHAAGVDLVGTWGALGLGESAPRPVTARTGVRYHWLEGDLHRALAERRGGLVRDVAGCLVYRVGAVHSLGSVRDPGPGLAWVRHVAGTGVGKLVGPRSRAWRGVRRRAVTSLVRAELAIVGDSPWHGRIIDSHAHLGRDLGSAGPSFAGQWPDRPVAELVAVLDAAGVEAVVDLDGGWGERLEEELERYQRPYPDRFAVLCGLDYASLGEPGDVGTREAIRLRDSAARGARGLKVWKRLGLSARDARGARIALDDERLDPIWATAAAERLPVVIHVGDPPAFFEPLAGNPRRAELEAYPDWHLHGRGGPSHEALIAAFETLLARHRGTTFVAAHLASMGHDIPRLSAMLDRHPNLYVDTAARLSELAVDRPRARELLIRHADRVLLGTDMPPDRLWFRMHRRFLASRRPSLAYHRGEWPAGEPCVLTGLALPAAVLDRIARGNAARLFFGLRAGSGA
jgi:predicted TIM-barrel fold metal-dependent hydrolase/predicted ATP-grasp superfamily ATP-dependent carboligase